MRSDWLAKGALYLKRWHRIVLDEGEPIMLIEAIARGVANLVLSPSHSHKIISDLSSRVRHKGPISLVPNWHSNS